MESREVLEALVALLATLGQLAANVAGPDGDVLRAVSPRSLRAALRKFIWHVRCTLNHQSVTPLGQHSVTSLRLALSSLKVTTEAPLDRERLTATVSAWRESVATLRESWDQLAEGATKLQDDWENAPTRWGQQPGAAKAPLESLVDACDKATVFPWELQCRLEDIEATLEGTKEASPDVSVALEAAVAEAERLWEASARLTTCHLLGTLGDIYHLLVSRGRGIAHQTVAGWCQKAIVDIPQLLGGQ